MLCNLCPRRCNSERTATENINGFCRMPLLPRVARAALHFWEEPCISGTNGSGTVFFAGCPLGCVFCQNDAISHGRQGKTVTVERLAQIFFELEQQGAHNINLVTPTHYALAIRDALQIYRPKIPVVYNAGGYERVETLKMLAPLIDIYLMDYKYTDSAVAARYSAAADYPAVAQAALTECYRQQPEFVCDENGILQKGVIVRHLLLPQATRQALAAFEFVRTSLPHAAFSLMAQYIPCGKARTLPPIDRRITKREYEKVAAHICASGFENCFLQDRVSADSCYIPPFDERGV